MPRQVEISGVLPLSAREVWSRVITTDFVLNMSYPAFRYQMRSPSPTPTVFEKGHYQMAAIALGFIQLDTQEVESNLIADDTRGIYILNNVSKGWPYSWDHRIALFAQTDGTCRYEDGIDIFSGPAPLLFRTFTRAIFQMRRRNWVREFTSSPLAFQTAAR